MADREVKATRKDNDGDILALCNEGELWSPRKKWGAINDIEDEIHTYFVKIPGYDRVDIHVAGEGNGRYLRTDPDKTDKNNLDELPDC